MAHRLSGSSFINDLIRKSPIHNPGPPALYRLHTTRSNLNEDSKIRKWTFGQKDGNLQSNTVLMVGETGTGKTTLINTMVNCFLGVKFEDKVWFEITEEEQRDQTESKTSEITVYEINSEERLSSLTIIDTPGYGDTRGLEKDMDIARNLRDLFLHDAGVKDLDAVCLVLKASQNRISDRQRYIFEGVLSLFGKDIEDIIVLFITHSDGGPPTNALESIKKGKVPCCHDNEDKPVYFLFNNRQSETRTQQFEHFYKSSWKMGARSMEEFLDFIKSQQRKTVTLPPSVPENAEWAQRLKNIQRASDKESTNSAVRFSDASSVHDLIKKSELLREGPPAWHRLYTTRSDLNKDGKIRKWTFGQKCGDLQNNTILMVGEPGTGKTTLINTMVNYFLGVKFEDKVWFEITEEERRDQSETQTSEVTVYEIISEERLSSLTIIDIPGYGNTRGIEKDVEIAQNLHELFLHDAGVKDLDAVCLVLKASQNRISGSQRYIFEAVLSLFGKDIEDIIVLFITFSDGGTPTNALEAIKKEKIPCCYDDEDEPVHFLFNNRQSETRIKKYEQVSRSAWEMGERSMEEFFKLLKSRQSKSVTLTVSVLNERMQLEACVESLKERIKFSEAKHSELTEVQKTLTQHAFRKVETEHKVKQKMKEEMMKLESKLKTLLIENEEKKKSLVKEAYVAIIKLSEIALKPDSAFTFQYLDFLIPLVEEAGTAEWAQKLKELQRAAASQESTNSAVEYLERVRGFFSRK